MLLWTCRRLVDENWWSQTEISQRFSPRGLSFDRQRIVIVESLDQLSPAAANFSVSSYLTEDDDRKVP